MTLLLADWGHTKDALSKLEGMLQCCKCEKTVQEPCVLGGCEHFFCRECVETVMGNECPVCGIPSHVKDMQPNRQLATAVSLCKQLSRLLIKSVDDATSHTTESSTYEKDESEIMNPPNKPQKKDSNNKGGIQSPSPVKTSNEARKQPMSVFDYITSPTMNSTPIGRRTRKGKKKSRKQEAVKVSNKIWGFNTSDTSDETFCKLNESCQSCRKSNRSRRVRILTGSTSCSSCEEPKKSLEEEIMNADSDGEVEKEPVTRTSTRKRSSKTSCEQAKITDYTAEAPAAKRTAKPVLKKQPARKKRSSELSDNANGGTDTVPADEGEIIDLTVVPDKQPWLSPVAPSTSTTRSKRKKSPQKVIKNSGKAQQQLLSPKRTPISKRNMRLMRNSPGSPAGSPGYMKKNTKGETPLHVVAIKGDLEGVRTLLEEGALPNVKDNAGWTPLHEACNHGFKEIAQLLLDHGAFVNIPGMENDTPLHDAVCNNRLECVRLLVARGASTNVRNIHGYTPVDVARSKEMKEALDTPLAHTQATKTQTKPAASFEEHQVVLLPTGLSREQKTKLKTCASMLHGKLVTDFSNEVTHVVSLVNAQGMCPRTMKYLSAIVTGKWIVTFDWVEVCLEYKERVSEEPFEVPGASTSPDSQAPGKARSNRQQQLPGLFDGCNFYFVGEFTYPTAAKDELIRLVKNGGGNILSREPKVENIDESALSVPYHANPNSQLENCSHYIIHDNKDKKPTLHSNRLCSATATWLIDCIAYFKLLDSKES